MSEPRRFTISADDTHLTIAGYLRPRLPGLSWSQIRRLIETRQVRIGDDVCVDPARRLREGLEVEILTRPASRPHDHESVVIRHLDQHLVVVEKPAGVATVRHPVERNWPARRKMLHPTLEDIVPRLIAQREQHSRKGVLPRLRRVQRLDKETSGLVVFARSVMAERELGQQFKHHTVIRRYLAIIPGFVSQQTVATRLVRDRGDGRRGSTSNPGLGKEAITHIELIERLPKYSLLACRLETGRTHQIRIHLAELGHPICGEKVYNRRAGMEPRPDTSGAPRLALHATELGFVHPVTGESVHWTMPLPDDLAVLLTRLRTRAKKP